MFILHYFIHCPVQNIKCEHLHIHFLTGLWIYFDSVSPIGKTNWMVIDLWSVPYGTKYKNIWNKIIFSSHLPFFIEISPSHCSYNYRMSALFTTSPPWCICIYTMRIWYSRVNRYIFALKIIFQSKCVFRWAKIQFPRSLC